MEVFALIRATGYVALLEYATLAWNLFGAALLLFIVTGEYSVAILGYGLNSLIQVLPSVFILVPSLSQDKKINVHRLHAIAFFTLGLGVIGLIVASLVSDSHYAPSYLGLVWLGITYFALWILSWQKQKCGKSTNDEALIVEAKANLFDAYISLSVMSGILLNAFCDFWWADQVAALIIAGCAIKRGITAWKNSA